MIRNGPNNILPFKNDRIYQPTTWLAQISIKRKNSLCLFFMLFTILLLLLWFPIRNLLPSERSVSYWMLLLVHSGFSPIVFWLHIIQQHWTEIFLVPRSFTLVYTLQCSVHSPAERCRVKFYCEVTIFYDSFGRATVALYCNK